MTTPSTVSGDQLANALQALGVNFIMGGQAKKEALHKRPRRLLAALAQSDEARLRLALIPLFLEHPEFARHVRAVAKQLDPSARLTLQCYFTAALWLAQTIPARRISLPDLFSKELDLSITDDPEKNLRTLAKRQRELSGMSVNWFGTYQHAVQTWRKGLELKQG